MAIETTFLDHLKKFSLIVNKRVTSIYSGQKLSTSAGRGISFRDHRIYSFGDDFRSIDWKVFARTDDLYIKNFEEERNLNVHILVDYSASMNFGKPISKFDYSAMIGVGFAYLAMKDNEKFQFATFSDKLNIFQPRRGMHQLAAMVSHLNTLKIEGKTDFLTTLMSYKKLIGSRSLIIIISDMLFDTEQIKDALLLLGNHDIKLIQVLDHQEKELKLEGDFLLKDSESKDVMKTFVSPRLVKNYTKMLDDHTAQVKDICNSLNIDFYQVTTSKPIFDTFYEVLKK
jgi:uncharacterized protein (DUF58 family)